MYMAETTFNLPKAPTDPLEFSYSASLSNAPEQDLHKWLMEQKGYKLNMQNNKWEPKHLDKFGKPIESFNNKLYDELHRFLSSIKSKSISMGNLKESEIRKIDWAMSDTLALILHECRPNGLNEITRQNLFDTIQTMLECEMSKLKLGIHSKHLFGDSVQETHSYDTNNPAGLKQN